jgi:dolichyl-phosphate beta-glucosyltransferase
LTSVKLGSCMNQNIVIVVPCYNETARFNSRAFQNYLLQFSHIHIIFVNDGSTDGTDRMLDDLAKKASRQVSCLHLSRNMGKAEAVRQGFLKGFMSKPALIGYLDADLAAPVSVIQELERYFSDSRCEIAMGARIKDLGRRIERNRFRHILGRLFAMIASFILRLPVYDTQCGAKLFRMTPRLQKVFSYPFTVRWIFDVEILARYIISRKQDKAPGPFQDICIEHPLSEWVDHEGSKVKVLDFIDSAVDILKIAVVLHIHDKKHPYWQKLA